MPRELSEFERLPRFLICQRHRPPPCTRCRNPVNPGANIYFKKRVDLHKKNIPEDQGIDPPSICCGIIGKRKSWTVRHLAARFLTEICLHQGYCKVQVLLFSFLFWPDRQSITSITGNETRTQHLQNITILTLALEFKWGSTKMCFFSLAILCRFWEMWERVLTRELPQGELHFSHCIFWCSCKKKRNYETKMTYFTASSSYQALTTKHKHMITMKNIKMKSPLRRDDHHHFFRMKFGAKLPMHHAKASQMQQIMMFCQTLYNLHCRPPNQLCNRLDFSIYFAGKKWNILWD